METSTQQPQPRHLWIYNPEARIVQHPYYLADDDDVHRRENDKWPQAKQTAIVKFLPGLNSKSEQELVACGIATTGAGSLRVVSLTDLDPLMAGEMFRNTTSVSALLRVRFELAAQVARHPHLAQVIQQLDVALRERADYKPAAEPEDGG